jgi:hypothetical protein
MDSAAMRRKRWTLAERLARPLALPTTLQADAGGGGADPAAAYIAKVLSYTPFAYWTLGDASGTTAVDQVDSPNQDGTYNAADIAGAGTSMLGGPAALLVAADADKITLPHAQLAEFDGAKGWLVAFFKVSGVGVWTDGTFRYVFRMDSVTAGNFLFLRKSTGNNTFQLSMRAGAVDKTVPVSSVSTIGTVMAGMTWDTTQDELNTYWMGSPIVNGSLSGLGTWAGLPNFAAIGGDGSAIRTWDGTLEHVAIGAGAALSDADMLDLASPLL